MNRRTAEPAHVQQSMRRLPQGNAAAFAASCGFVGPYAAGHTRRVAPKSKWGISPRESVEAEVKRQGKAAVVAGCRSLLAGGEADKRLILALGGRPARWAAGVDEPAGPAYWLRVWAARGLLVGLG